MITFEENLDIDEKCHECDEPAEIKLTGKHRGCHFCGNEIFFCLYHLRTMTNAASDIRVRSILKKALDE